MALKRSTSAVGGSAFGGNDQRLTANFGRIGVLMGGASSEREISLKSGKAIFESLLNCGFDVVAVDIQTEKKDANIKLIRSYALDCAFLALHGRFGEDGQIQSILDSIGLPYTGSGAKASKLAMDKISSREIFKMRGIKVPAYKILEKSKSAIKSPLLNSLSFPLIVKPVTGGSSIGLTLVNEACNLKKALSLAFKFDDRILIEEYICGKELTVGILHETALPVIQIVPNGKLFDYEAKYTSGMTEYLVPAPIDKISAKRLQDVALSAHKALGCQGCSRVDIILREDQIPYVLELNSIPGFTETSLLPKAARSAGIEFAELCIKLIKLAYEKK